MLNMWRDAAAGGPSTAWTAPPRPSAQTAVGQSNQGSGVSGGQMPGQATLLQVAVHPSSLQSAGGPHATVGQQAAGQHTNQQHGNQTTVGSRPPHHTASRSTEMSLMLAENLAESVLNHQSTATSGQVNNGTAVTAKQFAAVAAVGASGAGVGGGLEKSMGRLSMVRLIPYKYGNIRNEGAGKI